MYRDRVLSVRSVMNTDPADRSPRRRNKADHGIRLRTETRDETRDEGRETRIVPAAGSSCTTSGSKKDPRPNPLKRRRERRGRGEREEREGRGERGRREREGEKG